MKKLRGFSIVELLVALTIGSVLIAGTVYIYSQSRRTSMVTDAVGRLQENGRYVFSILEPDVQLAGYYGFSNSASNFKFVSDGDTSTTVSAYKMQQTATAVAGIDDAQVCGSNFAIDLLATVEGSNKSYPFPGTCAAEGGGYQTDTDTLTIRRSSNPPTDGIGKEQAGRLQLLVNRLSPTNQFVFADGTLPAEPALQKNQVQVRDLVVRTYYISKNSTDPAAKDLPALRMKALDGLGFTDTEIMRGVEDLQVQFGIDTGDYDGDGKIDPGLDEVADNIPDYADGLATRYVNADNIPAGYQVASVRIWILLRAEQPEQGFVNSQTYTYADRTYVVNDGYRRVLMSRTIQLRNARTL